MDLSTYWHVLIYTRLIKTPLSWLYTSLELPPCFIDYDFTVNNNSSQLMLSKSLHLSFILPPPLTHCSNKNCSYLGCGWPSHCKIQWLFPVLILFDPSPASVAHYILLGILSFVGCTNSLILPFFFFGFIYVDQILALCAPKPTEIQRQNYGGEEKSGFVSWPG